MRLGGLAPAFFIIRGKNFMTTSNTVWLAGIAMAIGLAAQVQAQTPADSDPQSEMGAVNFGLPADAAELAGQRGGASVTSSEMMLVGTTADNAAVNVVTGTNTIAAGAFSSLSGLPLVVQNSGANVLIQNAVILNVQMQ
jgi:hypothetical protein